MRYIALLFLLFALSTRAQEQINFTDQSGQKQGLWIAKFPNGKTRYEGSFTNGKPVGQWRRFHENGKPKAILNHTANSLRVEASLFDDEGILYATGIFTGSEKDSVWTYYNNQTVVGYEEYRNGKRNGRSVMLYADGVISREVNYSNDLPEGLWREFYPSGKVKFEQKYQQGKRNGWSIAYYENGQPQAEGRYIDDNPEGEWNFLDEAGNSTLKLQYQNGHLTNPEALDSLQKKAFDTFDRMKGKIAEPSPFRQ